LGLVVNARLRDLIREELGASYAPNASVGVLAEPKSWVDTIIEVESDPDRVDEVSQVVRQELERIRSGELDQRYLDLAVEQLAESYRFFNNNQWLDLLLFHTRYRDRPAGEFHTRTSIAQQLTIADMAEIAAQVFPPTRSVEIQLIPAN
jgi:predicted Zn-dependent peptidase